MTLLLLFAILQVADAGLTYRVLSKGGKELNPVMRWIFDRIGVIPGLVVAKGVITAAVWLYAPFEVVAGLCVLYAVVVGWNIYQAIKQEKA